MIGKKHIIALFISFACCFGYAQTYAELKQQTKDKKVVLRQKYESAVGDNEKSEIIKEAQSYLLNIAGTYFEAWYNTPWDFNGHTKIPKKGTIACGYFITTVLQDMGFNIPRIKWAQQTSEYMIKKMTSDIQRFRGKPMFEVTKHIENSGEGLYVVGLDCHVGFIYYVNGKMSFVHSNYYQPKIGVMSEPLTGRNPLNDSKYRVIGKILDDKMIQNWLLDIAYLQ